MRFYVGDELEIRQYGILHHGTVTGFYENRRPRIVTKGGQVIGISEYSWDCPERWAIINPGPERLKIQKFFNQRSFFDRLCYLFTGKMP